MHTLPVPVKNIVVKISTTDEFVAKIKNFDAAIFT